MPGRFLFFKKKKVLIALQKKERDHEQKQEQEKLREVGEMQKSAILSKYEKEKGKTHRIGYRQKKIQLQFD